MLGLTRKTDYALVALAYLSARRGSGSPGSPGAPGSPGPSGTPETSGSSGSAGTRGGHGGAFEAAARNRGMAGGVGGAGAEGTSGQAPTYAVRAGGRGESASAREIADQFHMPLPLLMNVLKDLARARLVTSTRGAAGGYVLAMDPRLVTLSEVVTAVEGPSRLTVCSSSELPILGQEGCQVSGGCPIEGPIRRLHARLGEFFEKVTLADLLAVEAPAAVALEASKLAPV